MRDEEFRLIQADRGKKGGLAKGVANTEKREKALEMRLEGCNQQQIADVLQVSRRTVIRWLKLQV